MKPINEYGIRLAEDRFPMLVQEAVATYYPAGYYPAGRDAQSPGFVVDFLTQNFRITSLAEEYVYLICHDASCNVIAVFEISHGTLNASIVSCRETFQRALAVGAYGIIVVHNHPGGSLDFSGQDIAVMKKLKAAGEIMDICLTDFIVVSYMGYTSAKEIEIL